MEEGLRKESMKKKEIIRQTHKFKNFAAIVWLFESCPHFWIILKLFHLLSFFSYLNQRMWWRICNFSQWANGTSYDEWPEKRTKLCERCVCKNQCYFPPISTRFEADTFPTLSWVSNTCFVYCLPFIVNTSTLYITDCLVALSNSEKMLSPSSFSTSSSQKSLFSVFSVLSIIPSDFRIQMAKQRAENRVKDPTYCCLHSLLPHTHTQYFSLYVYLTFSWCR